MAISPLISFSPPFSTAVISSAHHMPALRTHFLALPCWPLQTTSCRSLPGISATRSAVGRLSSGRGGVGGGGRSVSRCASAGSGSQLSQNRSATARCWAADWVIWPSHLALHNIPLSPCYSSLCSSAGGFRLRFTFQLQIKLVLAELPCSFEREGGGALKLFGHNVEDSVLPLSLSRR